MKTCSKCSINKEYTEFNKRSSSSDGYHGSCKACRAVVNKNRYDSEDVELRIRKRREYNLSTPEDVKQRKVIYDKKYFASEAGKITTAKSVHKRRAQKLSTEDGTVTSQALEDLKQKQNKECHHCSCTLDFSAKGQVHLDHLKPLSKGGSHTITNVVWSCASCNLKKSATYHLDG